MTKLLYLWLLPQGEVRYSHREMAEALHVECYQVSLGLKRLRQLRLLAETKLTLSGGTTVGRKSTIASGGSVTMSGGTEALNPYTSGGKISVGIAIIGVGDVTLSGGSVYYGSVWGGGDVTMSGGTSIFGGVATMGDITLTGGAFVDANVTVDNDELPQTSGRGVTSLSRR